MQFQKLLADRDICFIMMSPISEKPGSSISNKILVVIVGNTSPISNLAKVGQLSLIQWPCRTRKSWRSGTAG
ncbi:hypothetical protein NC974_25915 [Leptolyngbya sp. SLC-A1]|uniref:hypothetical protein n=1 Tax=unclassified Phormidium TaxID=2609805 RepID=UPI001F553D5C|nr:hypothetical protein [Leptolyngbya sp. FACHB-60]